MKVSNTEINYIKKYLLQYSIYTNLKIEIEIVNFFMKVIVYYKQKNNYMKIKNKLPLAFLTIYYIFKKHNILNAPELKKKIINEYSSINKNDINKYNKIIYFYLFENQWFMNNDFLKLVLINLDDKI